jgi:hypothetical protein
MADRAALQAPWRTLPPPLLEVILLCDVEEMKYREIAATLEIPIGTVMSRIARARAALRTALDGSTEIVKGVSRMTDHLSHDILNALVDGELSADQLASANQHLAGCPSCTSNALYQACSSPPRQRQDIATRHRRNCSEQLARLASQADSQLQPRGLRATHYPFIAFIGDLDRWAGPPRLCSFLPL